MIQKFSGTELQRSIFVNATAIVDSATPLGGQYVGICNDGIYFKVSRKLMPQLLGKSGANVSVTVPCKSRRDIRLS